MTKTQAIARRVLMRSYAGVYSPAVVCRMFGLKPKWKREPKTWGRRHG